MALAPASPRWAHLTSVLSHVTGDFEGTEARESARACSKLTFVQLASNIAEQPMKSDTSDVGTGGGATDGRLF